MEEAVLETKEENIPSVPAEQAMTTTKEETTEALAAKMPEPTTLGNILDSPESFLQTAKMAKMLSQANMLPRTFAGQPGNCMILIDMAKRSGMSVLFVAQNLYIVSGNPSWSGQACIALINNCGRFTPIKFDEKYVSETEWECTAYATEKATGDVVRSTTINYELAKNAGWYDKSGTYWKKMPMQMAKYLYLPTSIPAASAVAGFSPTALSWSPTRVRVRMNAVTMAMATARYVMNP